MKVKSKRLYNKPKISKVRLLPEEAVLRNCKAIGDNKLGSTSKCSSLVACSTKKVGS